MSSVGQSHEVENLPLPTLAAEELRWYALHTRARHERVVEHRLREQGMESFLPTFRETHRWSDRKKIVEVPLFSCYVFVRCVLNADDRTRVYRVDSALGFVGTRGLGVPIPDEQIESVRSVLSQTAPCRSHPFLKVGQRVRVCGGAMDGGEGVFLSSKCDQSLVASVDVIQRSLAGRIRSSAVKAI